VSLELRAVLQLILAWAPLNILPGFGGRVQAKEGQGIPGLCLKALTGQGALEVSVAGSRRTNATPSAGVEYGTHLTSPRLVRGEMSTFAYAEEHELVGSSSAMAALRCYVNKVAQSDASVLICGATGTGKELVANSIHRASQRRSGPFISVNCAAIPDSLLESELFGYERGAFTGAGEQYPGKLRLADHGTVFLDEIGEMSLQGQAKILRVLETRELFPLGARRMIKIDVRFIAATNQELEPMIERRAFRQDLFFRISAGRIALPSLKEHPEDILELFLYYLKRFNRESGRNVQGPTPELADRLTAYDWPGNVRELRNCLEALFIDPPDGPIELEHLSESFQRIFRRHQPASISERDAIVLALSRTNWNKKMAARELRWSRMTLYRKLEKYKITGSH
jgi:transcriptional regulator with PAS, ATPase and Fis domain